MRDHNRIAARPRRHATAVLAATAAALTMTAGCTAHSDDHPTSHAAPASAALSPPTHTTPAGTVAATAPIAALLVEPTSGRLAQLDTSGTTLHLLDPTGATPPRTLTLPAPATALTTGAPGELLAPAGHRILHIDTTTGAQHTTPTDTDVRTVTRRSDGTLAAGLPGGRVEILDPDGHTHHTVSGLGAVDAITSVGTDLATLDLAQTSLDQLDLDHYHPGLTLRAGMGATTLLADHFGRVLATDTAGGALMVYTLDPLVLRQRYPVGSSPYALSYDTRTDTVWVTLTGTNEVAGYDLSTGIPKQVGRFPTVRQPNSVTIDDHTGDMFVGSATGDGIQRISADQRKGGQ